MSRRQHFPTPLPSSGSYSAFSSKVLPAVVVIVVVVVMVAMVLMMMVVAVVAVVLVVIGGAGAGVILTDSV